MTTLLVIKSSPSGKESLSNNLVNEFVAEYQAKHGDVTVIERDLGMNPLPYVGDARMNVMNKGKTENLTDEEKSAQALTLELVEEYKQADIVIVGTPVYNFTIPANLKSWIDHVVALGHTIQFTAEGLKVLVEPKKIVVLQASSMGYQTMGAMNAEFTYSYLKSLFTIYFGVTEIHHIEVKARDEESKPHASERVKEVVDALAKSI